MGLPDTPETSRKAPQTDGEVDAPRVAVARIWRGRTLPENADLYEAYLRVAGIPPLARTALGVSLLRRDGPGETAFVTISWWESVAAMARFTGGSPTRIHHLPRDPELLLLALPRRVEIFDLRTQAGRFALGAAR